MKTSVPGALGWDLGEAWGQLGPTRQHKLKKPKTTDPGSPMLGAKLEPCVLKNRLENHPKN